MQYNITCPDCQQPLTVNTGWEGQHVNCPLCQKPFIMPPPVFVREVPTNQTTPPPPKPTKLPSLWNPTAAANWSVLFGPIFGTSVHYLNWKALGDEKMISSSLNWLVVASVLTVWGIATLTSSPDSDVVALLFIVFLFSWYFVSARGQIKHVNEQLGGRYDRRSWKTPLASCFFAIFLTAQAISISSTLVRVVTPERSTSKSPVPVKQTSASFYDLSGEEAVQAARQHVVGTWTFAEPEVFDPVKQWAHGWIKWIIKEDGTMLMFRAAAVADGWGEGVTSKWEIGTGKYSDTGTRYYMLKPGDGDWRSHPGDRVLISPDGRLEFRRGDGGTLFLVRGDKFPFSK